MSNSKKAGGFSSLVASLTIAITLVIGFLVYYKIFGNPSNFEDNNPLNEPIDHNVLGTIYKGGFIVPFLVAVNLIVIIFSLERFVTLNRSKGRGNINKFITKIKGLVDGNDIPAAIEECDKQKGSLANVRKRRLQRTFTTHHSRR